MGNILLRKAGNAADVVMKLDQRELLNAILLELRIMNMHLEEITGNNITERDNQ